MDKVVIIVQARMRSTRLPGKVLLEVGGKPLLTYLLERLQKVKNADEVVVATTKNKEDDSIVQLCEGLGVRVYRGSDGDVLERFNETAVQFDADVVVRITADCPLMDPSIVEYVIQEYADHKAEYASNTLDRTYPRGMDVEVFSTNLLSEVADIAVHLSDREHVTSYIYTHPHKYLLNSVRSSQDFSKYRWTVDTAEDFKLISKMIKGVYPNNPQFAYEDLLQLMEDHPEWKEINAGIEQKPL